MPETYSGLVTFQRDAEPRDAVRERCDVLPGATVRRSARGRFRPIRGGSRRASGRRSGSGENPTGRPSGGLRASATSSTRPRRRTTTAASRTASIGRLAFGGGISCCRPCWFARHSRPAGQASQRGVAGRADFAAQFHQRLVEPSGIAPRQHGLGHRPENPLAFGRSRVAVVGQQPAQEPQRVGLQDRLAGVEGDREDGPGRVAADARQAADDLRIAGKAAAVLGHDDPGRLVELPRPAVIAQPFPQPQDLVLVGRRGPRSWATPPGIARSSLDRRHLRLLEHDLAHPDRVGIAVSPPGQSPGVASVPGQQPPPERPPPGASGMSMIAFQLFSLLFPRSAWEPAESDAPRRMCDDRAICSHDGRFDSFCNLQFAILNFATNPVARLAHHLRRDALHVDRRGGAAGAGRSLEEHLLQRDVLRPVGTVPRRRPGAVQARRRACPPPRPGAAGRCRPRRKASPGGQSAANSRKRRGRRDVGRPAGGLGNRFGHRLLGWPGPNHQRRQMPRLAQVPRHGGIALGGPKLRRPARARIDDRKAAFQADLSDDLLPQPCGLPRARALGSGPPATRCPAAGAVRDSGRPRAWPWGRPAGC